MMLPVPAVLPDSTLAPQQVINKFAAHLHGLGLGQGTCYDEDGNVVDCGSSSAVITTEPGTTPTSTPSSSISTSSGGINCYGANNTQCYDSSGNAVSVSSSTSGQIFCYGANNTQCYNSAGNPVTPTGGTTPAGGFNWSSLISGLSTAASNAVKAITGQNVATATAQATMNTLLIVGVIVAGVAVVTSFAGARK